VLDAVLQVDIIAPSLDAADSETFHRINRPHPELAFERVIGGLRDLCRRFNGVCRVEVLLVRGMNDAQGSLQGLAALARELAPSCVDLNTVARPPLCHVEGLDRLEMAAARQIFENAGCPTDVVAEAPCSRRVGLVPHERAPNDDLAQRVVEVLARRPSTAGQLAAALDLHEEAVSAACEEAVAAGMLRRELREGKVFFVVLTSP
jgi:wyosine [tRNA(Phe)-imidazoG37] synthetase (radical SAM superfamily)